MSKNCLKCRHSYIDEAWGGTDETPGETGRWGCNKNHYYQDTPEDKHTILCLLAKAETCPDYTPEPRYADKDVP